MVRDFDSCVAHVEEFPVLLEFAELIAHDVAKAPILAGDDLLTSRELELGSLESFNCVLGVGVLATNGEQNLANGDAGTEASGLAKGTSHAGLQPIGSGTAEHLIDPENVEGVRANSQMEAILPSKLGHVLVGTDAGCFESFTAQLFMLATEKVGTEGEFINLGLLVANVINPNLGIRDTTAISGLDVGLPILIAITAGWSSSH